MKKMADNLVIVESPAKANTITSAIMSANNFFIFYTSFLFGLLSVCVSIILHQAKVVKCFLQNFITFVHLHKRMNNFCALSL